MSAPLREERQTSAGSARSQTGRENVVYYWDPEELVAQQLENELRLRYSENTQIVLDNIEQNIQYTRNKAAAWFYLAGAYERLRLPDKAVEIYNALLNNFNNRKVVVCALSAPRLNSGNWPLYAVSIWEEAALRLYLLTGEALYLELLRDSAAVFGPEISGETSYTGGFLYADLAADNSARPAARISSYAYYTRLFAAQEYAQSFIAYVRAQGLPGYKELDYLDKAEEPLMPADSARIRAAESTALTLAALHKTDDGAYLYTFLYNDVGLKIDLKAEGRAFYIKRVYQ
ncbi:hypothetical protein NO1_0519 [Candidatus Termititenax aidoneus]|uniref:Uncharacterized protein n=1 Tax=Termititenax aidoneus TaxID=2218524 RepID=A0A388T971_TERA1|nr:hypothetical protein NO1_0519 [Candidatus Termititenax aidoneus]